jgi:beta-fructofuranosidase
VIVVSLVAAGKAYASPPPESDAGGAGTAVPRIVGQYVNVYQPAGDTFPGPDVGPLVTGKHYEEWVANDHCFVKDQSGRWHAFGITHPRTDLENVHLGEHQSFHAIAPKGSLKKVLKKAAWQDLPKVLPPGARPGERLENHAPYIVRRSDLYCMLYGPTPIRQAVSKDLLDWTPRGPLENAPSGRDPSILFWNDTYHLIVCGVHDVRIATSEDFKDWKRHKPILTMKRGIDPESPSIVRYENTFYLFVCGWNGIWNRKELQGAYQHLTYVYRSNNPLTFDLENEVATINAHAPEIFQDEDGDWYISSAEWPHRGVSIARLAWD